MTSPSNLSWADFGSESVSWADTTEEEPVAVAKTKAVPEPEVAAEESAPAEPEVAVAPESPAPKKAGNPWGRVSDEAAPPAKIAPKLRGEPTPAEAARLRQEQRDREASAPAPSGAYAPPRRGDSGRDQGGYDGRRDGGYGGRDAGYGGRDAGYGGRNGGRDGGYGGRDAGYGGRDGGYGGRDGGYGGRDAGYGGRDGGYGGRREERRERDDDRAPPQLPTSPPFKAFMGNLDFNVTEQDVFEFMGVPEEDVVDIAIPRDALSDRPKGFAIVEFASVEGLKQVLSLHQSNLMGRTVRVDVSQARDRGSRDEPSRADTADNWRAAPRRQFDAAPSRRGGDDRRRDDRFDDRDGGESWLNRPRQPSSNYQAPRQPAERPKLVLKPRTKPVETVGAPVERTAGSDPFGGAKPRDETAYQRRLEKKREEERKRREAEREQKQQQQQQQQNDSQAKGEEGKSKSERYQPRRGGERSEPGARRENSRFDKSWGSSSTGERRQAWNNPRSRQQRGGAGAERVSGGDNKDKQGWNSARKQRQTGDSEKEASATGKDDVANRFEALAEAGDQ